MNQAYNIFDVEAYEKQKKADEALWDRLDTLIHRTFAQTESGRELLGEWEKALIMTPTVTPVSTQFQVGIEEGKKEFIRNIKLSIMKIEDKVND